MPRFVFLCLQEDEHAYMLYAPFLRYRTALMCLNVVELTCSALK
jgi:hypothetical protein